MSLAGLIGAAGSRARILITRLLARFGAGSNAFLVIVAVIIGLITAAAAVGFHELIVQTRDLLYERFGEERLYGNWLFMLVVWPALGGLIVGIISRKIARGSEGHGVVDVMESVIRTRGFIRPRVAIEKIVTSAITIGTGGSTGAEGPIVQIGSALASGVGSVFNVARQQMPTIIACGAAAGISAIFNSPMGGMLFALEVILQDFSIRNVTPVVVASVIANVTTKAIFAHFDLKWQAIFHMVGTSQATVNWSTIWHFVVLGAACGLIGVTFTRLMYFAEAQFQRVKVDPAIRPAIGGAALGLMGVFFVVFFGRFLLGLQKPIPFDIYPMPAFFGDGYGVIQTLLSSAFYQQGRFWFFIWLLLFLLAAKIVATCLTLGSGGSGGVIAPSLFLGSVIGGMLGMVLRQTGLYAVGEIRPEVYALVGMGAVLAAVVHAPLASILILLELTGDGTLMLPAMLATVIATGTARLILPDSIYTLALRRRGVRVAGTGADRSLLHRMNVEQVDLEPASLLKVSDPFQRVLDLMDQTQATDFAVVDDDGTYKGMVVAEDVRTALIQREAVPLLLVEEMVRGDVPFALTSDDLATTMDAFAKYDVSHFAVCFPGRPGRVIGLIGRAALMRRYQQALQG